MFKYRLDFGDEGGNLVSKVRIRFSSFEKVQEFIADEIIKRLLPTKTAFDFSGRFALLDPDFMEYILWKNANGIPEIPFSDDELGISRY